MNERARQSTDNADVPFGTRLRRARESAGLTQESLAERAGLTPNSVGALERGEHRHPYPATVRALAEALGPNRIGARSARPIGADAQPNDRREAPRHVQRCRYHSPR